jgi:hypothetical protein
MGEAIRTRNIEHGTSNTEHRTRNIEHGTSNTEHRTRNIEHGTSNTEHRTSKWGLFWPPRHGGTEGGGRRAEVRSQRSEDGEPLWRALPPQKGFVLQERLQLFSLSLGPSPAGIRDSRSSSFQSLATEAQGWGNLGRVFARQNPAARQRRPTVRRQGGMMPLKRRGPCGRPLVG